MKKILALSLTFALASAFVGISDGIKTNSQNALRDQIDELHILASTVETNDKELAINDEYTINKANDYRILPRNIDTYREETNQNQVRNNTNNGAVVNNQTTTNQTTSNTNNNSNTQNGTNGVQNINYANGTNRVVNQTSSLNNVVNDGTTTNLNGVNSTNSINQNGTNNLSYNNQGTSPYGINNANSGVLPNQGNGNKTIDGVIANNNSNNLDSMVRTNNIDTYKNNTNTNIDGNVYNNNGGLVNNGANNGVVTNVPNANNTLNNNAQNTTNPNTADTNRNVVVDNNVKNNTTDIVDNNKNTTNSATTTTNTIKNDTTNNTTNQASDNATKNTTDITQSFVLDMATIQQDIADLNDRISAQNEEMNQNMELARANMAKLLDNSVTLEQEKIKLINGYSHTLQCMTQKLAQNHFDLMHSAGMLALVQSTEGNNADLSPIYLEIKGTLLSREIYFDCANDALKAINGVFGDTNDVSTLELNKNNTKPTETINNSKNTTKTTTPVKTITQNDKVVTQNEISQNKNTFEQKPAINNDRVTKDRITNGVDIDNAGIHARTLENKNMDRPVVNVRGPVKNQAKMVTPNPDFAEKQTINSPKARLDNSKQESQNVGFGKTNTNSVISSGQF